MAKPHYIYELPENEEKRLEEVFKKLDLDGNGKIDIHDLSEALKDSKFGQQYAEVSKGLFTFASHLILNFFPRTLHTSFPFLPPFVIFLLLRLSFGCERHT